MAETSFAMTAAAAAAQSGGIAGFLFGMTPFLLILVIFWVLMIRPQQKRMREHAARIAAVKKGDQVVTAGGIRGKVTRVEDADVEVEIASGVKVRVVKSTLSEVANTGSSPAND